MELKVLAGCFNLTINVTIKVSRFWPPTVLTVKLLNKDRKASSFMVDFLLIRHTAYSVLIMMGILNTFCRNGAHLP